VIMSDRVVMCYVWLSGFHEIDVVVKWFLYYLIMLIMGMMNFVQLTCLCA
jgi:hypothetical protein